MKLIDLDYAIIEAQMCPDMLIVNEDDYWEIRRILQELGQLQVGQLIWDRYPVIPSTIIERGTILCAKKYTVPEREEVKC